VRTRTRQPAKKRRKKEENGAGMPFAQDTRKYACPFWTQLAAGKIPVHSDTMRYRSQSTNPAIEFVSEVFRSPFLAFCPWVRPFRVCLLEPRTSPSPYPKTNPKPRPKPKTQTHLHIARFLLFSLRLSMFARSDLTVFALGHLLPYRPSRTSRPVCRLSTSGSAVPLQDFRGNF